MKKGWLVALGIILLLGISGYVYYSRLKKQGEQLTGSSDEVLKPRVLLSRFDLTNVTDEAVDVTARLLVSNPLPIGLEARKVDYTLYIDNEEVARDAYDKTIRVASQDSTLLTVPVKLYSKKLTSILKRLEAAGTDSTDYRILTTFDLDVPIAGERTFTVSQSVRGPVLYIPQINIVDIDLGTFGLNRTDVAAKVSCTNKNRLTLGITEAKYSVRIDGKLIADGSQPEPILIRKQATTPFVLPVTVKPGQSLGLLPKMLFDKKDTPVEVNFRCKLADRGDKPLFKESQFVTTIKGNLADFTKK